MTCSRASSADGKLYGHVADGYWEDVGTLEAYRTAHEDILDGRVEIDMPGFRIRDGVWLGENVDVSPDVVVEGPVLIGDNCRIETGAVLRPVHRARSTTCVVKAEAHIERTVVHDNAYLGPGARVRGAVLGRSCDIRDSVRIEEGVVVGDETFIGGRCDHRPLRQDLPVQVGRCRARVVNSSIVWETRGARTLFGRRGVRARERRRHRRRSRCAWRWPTAPRSRRVPSVVHVAATPVGRHAR